jgi:hypothetical protein
MEQKQQKRRRRIELRRFGSSERGEFGYKVTVYCRDKITPIRRTVFSANRLGNYFSLRRYVIQAIFLKTDSLPIPRPLTIEREEETAMQKLLSNARECLRNYRRDYDFADIGIL